MKTKYCFKNAKAISFFSRRMPANEIISNNICTNGGYFTIDDEYTCDNTRHVIDFENISNDDLYCAGYDMVVTNDELDEFFEEIVGNELDFYIDKYERKIVDVSYDAMKNLIETDMLSPQIVGVTRALCTLVFEQDGNIFANVVWQAHYAIIPVELLRLSELQFISKV